MNEEYIFKSERLGFRNWKEDDFNELANFNANVEVMEFFPKPLTLKETEAFIERTKKNYEMYGYNYFATEIIETGELIGFIGLGYETYESEFYPATNIGWRLKKSAWGKGYATEGAKRCLEFAFKNLNIKRIVASFTPNNIKSEKVIKKIGMSKKGEFINPSLTNNPGYDKFVCYAIENK